MARIAGIDLPKHKRGVIGLTYIFGIGHSQAERILTEAAVDFNKKVETWNDDELNKIRSVINDNNNYCQESFPEESSTSRCSRRGTHQCHIQQHHHFTDQ